ncbi:MAG: hypothetical protein P4L83_09935 [Nevskia sp.]|nr:hypothetical protein [Nevskia sp.]
MKIFNSEEHLLKTIAEHDALVQQCASGVVSFSEFCEKYNDFYAHYALDGHESDGEERALLQKYEQIIEPHRMIAYEILGKVCSDSDAKLGSYQRAGRFGPAEAVVRLRQVRLGASS